MQKKTHTIIIANTNTHFRSNMYILMYGYILTRVVYSFFNARFNEQIITTGFIWTIFLMLITRMFVEHNIMDVRVLDSVGTRRFKLSPTRETKVRK